MREKFIYILTIILSMAYLWFGYGQATENLHLIKDKKQEIKRVQVTEITKQTEKEFKGGGGNKKQVKIYFTASNLDNESELLNVIQESSPMFGMKMRNVQVGDQILVAKEQPKSSNWIFIEYIRSKALIILAGIFTLLLILFGGKKGISTIIALVFTCGAIFAIYIPAILSGLNIYKWTFITSIFIIITTLLLVNGANKKSLAAAIGCIGGIILAAILSVFMDKVLYLTGYVDEHSIYLANWNREVPLDLQAIIFGAIIIGAVGAIMDVAVDIAASLSELARKVEKISFSSLFQSGINIGRDIIGTMSNTLILAYIGSSLSVVLLITAYNGGNFLLLFNREMIAVEIAQALVGSIGILFTIPLTAAISAFLYRHK